MSHCERDVEPCLGCTFRTALEEWWERVRDAGDEKQMLELSHPAYPLTVLGQMIVDIILETSSPDVGPKLLEDLSRSMRSDLAEQLPEQLATHAAPGTMQ